MKLYKAVHLAAVSLFTAGATVVLLLILGFLQIPGDRSMLEVEEITGYGGKDPETLSEPWTSEKAPVLVIPVQDTGRTPAGYSNLSEDELQNTLIYQSLNEGVVNVTSVVMSYNRFLQPVPQEGSGSGLIIDLSGRVLTNYHVIKGAEELIVTLTDGSEYAAKVVGSDPDNDLAVIQFDPRGAALVTVPFGSSSQLVVGQKVLAIGNPFGLERTLTTGIISGLGRPIQTEDGPIIQEMIQTDASINPGNSGGPLLNTDGELIGINTMIYSPSGGSVGIGFAVPVNTAKEIVPELIAHGKIKRGWIDIVPVQLFPQLVQYTNLPVDEGVLVSEVEPNSPAAKAGLIGGSPSRALRISRGNTIYLGGDIITALDGKPVGTIADLYEALNHSKPGDRIEIRVMRGAAERTLRVILSERRY